MISSAVIVPDTETVSTESPSHTSSLSSISHDHRAKRLRLEDGDGRNSTQGASLPLAPPSSSPSRKANASRSRAAEERKRGQRLFGALLGTLSQSSTTTAQRRRADIEKKQLGKLQQRDEEVEEAKKRKREALDMIRRKEQTRLRHSNRLAEAHFLKTRAEPRLYFKPWELLPGEEDQIKTQIGEAEEVNQQEIAAQNAKHEIESDDQKVEDYASRIDAAHEGKQSQAREGKVHALAESTTEGIGPDPAADPKHDAETETVERDKDINRVESQVDTTFPNELSTRRHVKITEDHGSEMLVEGQEDDVIY